MMGDLTLRGSRRFPSEVTISAVASLFPTKRLSTMYCISSPLRVGWTVHHFSKPR